MMHPQFRSLAPRFLLVALAAACPAGCGGTSKPTIAEGAYDGPPLSIDQSGRSAVVIMEAPTPGWSISLDRASEARDHWQAFITVRRPNPAYMYSQVVVTQNLLTTVESRFPIRVYGRVLDDGAEAGDVEYREAARAAPAPNAPRQEREFPAEFAEPASPGPGS